jgi:protein TonB
MESASTGAGAATSAATSAAPSVADGTRGGSASRAGGDGVGQTALAVPGDGGRAGAEYGAYLALVRRRIQESLRYPAAARRRGLTGSVHVEMTVAPNGTIAAVSVVGSSSHPLLDDAAVEAVRRLPPMPFPSGVTPRSLRVRLPVVFELR